MAEKKLIARVGADISEFQRKMSKVSSSMRDTGTKFKKIGDKMSSIGKSMTAKVTAPIVGGMVAVVKGTEEYREEMGKLETAFTTNGHSVKDAQKVFKDFYGVLGETDRSVEAVNHLSKLTTTQEELSAWTDIATGVYAQFGDSLPIEGLTEAANETAKTGEITGVLADALNWAGVSEDKFKEKLEGANSEQERQEMITKTLNDLYSKSAEKYREVNGELIESREASISFKDAMAQLGKTLAPLLVKVTELGTKVINKFNQLSPTGKKLVGVVVAIAAAIGPILIVVGSAISLFGSLSMIAGTLGVSIGAIAAPIAIAIGAVVALIAIGVLLWKNWDTIKAKAVETWTSLKDSTVKSFNDIKTKVTNAVNTIKDRFNNFITNIKNNAKENLRILKDAFTSVWNNIMSFLKTVWNGIKVIAKAAWQGIKMAALGPVFTMYTIITSKFGSMENFLSVTWNGIKSIAGRVWEGIKNKIVSPIQSAKDKVLGIITSIKSAFKNMLIKIPKPKIPKISVSMRKKSFLGLSVPVPDFNLSWHKKGGMFAGPSMIGVGEQPGVKEAVIPMSGQHMKPFADEIANQMGGSGVTVNVENMQVREEQDIDKIAQGLYRLQQRKQRGGVSLGI